MKPPAGGVYTKRLYEQIMAGIAGPQLLVLSGFASASFSRQVLADRSDASVSLVVGMGAQTGMLRAEHEAFVELQSTLYPGRFTCKYYFDKPLIHSKIYVWGDTGNPSAGFAGSANFTWGGFRDHQEILVAADPKRLWRIHQSAAAKAVACTEKDAAARIAFIEKRAALHQAQAVHGAIEKKPPKATGQLDKIELSLLTRKGEIHQRAGLNWGQRAGRNPDQAYIQIPTAVDKSKPGFLPPRGHRFLLITDDDEHLWCVRAGDSAKHLETSDDNSRMGRYFRRRLGLAGGAFVRKEDLESYGRASVSIYKIDGDAFFMDFSSRGKPR